MKMGSSVEWRDWKREGGIWWLTAGLLVLGLIVIYVSPTRDSVRLTGFAYEIVGLFAVILEIHKARRKHNLIPLPRRVIAYLRRCPLLPQPKKIVAANAIICLASATVSAQGSYAQLKNETLDQRVERLDQQVKALADQIAGVARRVETEQKERSVAVKNERAVREAADTKIEEKIRDIEVGGLELSLFGACFLLVGVVLTTATDEVCRLLNCPLT